jgi:folate-dependent phosphoribosylglycinamide formyltransferase PurN
VLPGDTVEKLKERVQALEQAAFVEVLHGWRV